MAVELPKATITVRFRNELKTDKRGKKYGTIKAAEGGSYMAHEEDWKILEEGNQYQIDYQPTEPGKDFPPWIKAVRDVDGVPLTAPVRTAQQPVSTQKAMAKQLNGGANLDMCVCALMKAFISAGKVPLDAAAISKARTICQAGWLNEMDDEIPYP
jgi:hypothetical protein